ncbi:MAG: CDP-alcohol phosphatidyltransferase family protein [Candidatus Aenigmarchaeota archaeon]|nr:CDP-alcohol phosphatidyltransferase family protein [Candidatus Aenigmarchaeota archaeon]
MLKSGRPEAVDKIETAAGKLFSKIPMTPNQWTLLSVVLGAAGFLVSAVYRNLGQSVILFLAAFAADYIDGSVAKYRKKTTKLGAYIDGVSDRFVEAFIIVGLMFYDAPNILVDSKISLATLLFFSTMTSYTRAYADHKKIVTSENDLRKMGGLLERFERVSILLASAAASLYYGSAIIAYASLFLIVLSGITVVQRILYSVKEAGR